MNSIEAIETDYLRPDRTIETIKVSDDSKARLRYVYNYQGVSYRLFDSIQSLIRFFENGSECSLHFESEAELDEYLLKTKI